jgi:hypothetical protein
MKSTNFWRRSRGLPALSLQAIVKEALLETDTPRAQAWERYKAMRERRRENGKGSGGEKSRRREEGAGRVLGEVE